MAKKLRVPVVATDIDPIAVRTTLDNARRNEVFGDVITVRASGLDHQTIQNNAPYDLIVANILAGPLSRLAPDIADAAESGATIILSGILAGQAARVAAAYRQQGMVLRSRIVKNSWVTLILDKY
jgi:ribosomal protein L11 methyltransferase